MVESLTCSAFPHEMALILSTLRPWRRIINRKLALIKVKFANITRIKTLHSKMVTMYSLCFVKQNCDSTVLQLIDRLTDRDVLHVLMSWGRLVTSNGGRIYKDVIKQVVVGLIPLKLHPAAFGRKETWLRSKGTILNDIFQVIYVLKMIYQVGKMQCSN